MTTQSKVEKAIHAAITAGEEILDKVASPASRAGNTVERAAKMAKAGVDKTAIAAQLSSGSSTGHKYTPDQVETMVVLYEDCSTKVPLTKSATQALIKDAVENAAPDEDGVTA
ncbi:hypothetical protein VU607_01420 [Enterobacter cloacae]|uniref:hypothetical protein n=1 Tax=Enterobacter cloacae TaxID=550 RepID=UPI0021CE0DC9|nr:hypothetical protein [Enterobacter cloacae]ELK7439115.1 hypothetical protein [Enterobacter cloacae]ELV2844686.1 hypothetical protein [Enterobacter cloacae]MCU6250302.1 hypothetical protein [Enterobacter cloacae]MDR1751029.1 hypothetical protein [Enterobacter cloacae]WLD34095.1 hypothetical protein QTN38_010595 [Enterobacter cloacae subsp. cloacae]